MPVAPSARHAGPTPSPSARLLLVAADVPRDPRATTGLVARGRRLVRALRAATASTATSPAGTAPPRPVRSSTRWPTRCSCSGPCSRSSPRRVLVVPVAIIAGREFAHQRVPHVVGRAGHQRAGQQDGQGKTFVQQLAVGFALLPLTAADAEWLWKALPVGARSCSPRASRRPVPVADATHPVTRAGTGPRSPDALRRARGRHRTAARPDHRHQLGVDRRAARRQRHRLAGAGQDR